MQASFWSTIVLILLTHNYIFADELKVAFPSNIPPWTLQAEDSGITVEVVRKSLNIRGHKLKTRYLSLKQLNSIIDPDVDAHAQVESRKINGYYSDMVMEFQTSLISLKPNGFSIHTVNDLNNRHITAFLNASVLFGATFQSMAHNNPDYNEIGDQEQQVVLLYNGKTDFILIDRNIFLYFRQITAITNTSMPIVYHIIPGLTEKSPAFVVFKDENLRNDFNAGLQQLKNSGNYNDIVYKYTK